MSEVFITGASRTPMGGFQGEFDDVPAAALGGVAIKRALSGAGGPAVDELIMAGSYIL